MQIPVHRYIIKGYDWVILNGPKVLIALILFFVGLWFINIISSLLKRAFSKREFDPTVESFLLSFLANALRVFLVVALMQIVGVQMTIFAAAIGAFGVAAGLALSGTLQNFTSGILILLLKPFKVGDNIISQGQEGTVNSIQIFYTIVTTYDNKSVIIPNSKLSNEVIINISREGKRRLDFEIKFNFGVDFNQIKEILDETLKSNENILKEPERRIGITKVEADGYTVLLNVWINAHGFTDTRLFLYGQLLNSLKTSGIKLPGLESPAI